MKSIRFAIFAIWLCLFTPAVPQDKASSRAQVHWELTPLVSHGTDAIGTSGKFIQFGRAYWLGTGGLAFWGQFGPDEKKDWGFFSLKDNHLKLLFLEGKNSKPTVAHEPMDEIEVHRTFGWGAATLFWEGKDSLYIYTPMGITARSGNLYIWDGTKLKKILAKGQEVDLSGDRCKIESLGFRGLNSDGNAIFEYKAKKPCKAEGCLLYDGAIFTPLLARGDLVSGHPGVRIDNHLPFTFSAPTVFSNQVIAVVDVAGALYNRALFRFSKEKAEKILAIGDPFPLDTKRKITELISVRAGSPDSIAIHLLAGNTPSLILYHKGQFLKVFDETDVTIANQVISNLKDKSGEQLGFTLGAGEFLQVEPLRYVFFVEFSGKYPFQSGKYTWFQDGLPELILYDGKQLTILTKDIPLVPMLYKGLDEKEIAKKLPRVTGITYRKVTGEIQGILPQMIISTSGAFLGRIQMGPTLGFLPINAPETKIQVGPHFVTNDKRSIDLSEIIGWKKPSEAVVMLKDGIFLLSRR